MPYIRAKRFRYPGKSNLTPELNRAITKDFSTFEKALYSYDFDNKKFGYKKLIDVDNFVDYFLINELTCNYDAGYLSTYIYKGMDDKFHMSIWDFNSACDNYRETVCDPHIFAMQDNVWFFMLMKDEDFTDRVISRYRRLRVAFLSDDYLEKYIDETAEFLGGAIGRNYEKWGYSFGQEYDLLIPTERNPRTFEDSIESMKSFLRERTAWMDLNIESVKQYSARRTLSLEVARNDEEIHYYCTCIVVGGYFRLALFRLGWILAPQSQLCCADSKICAWDGRNMGSETGTWAIDFHLDYTPTWFRMIRDGCTVRI